MAEEEKKKNIFDKAFDAISSRDEKEELEKTRKELDDSRKAAAQAQASAEAARKLASQQTAATKAAAEKEIEAAKTRAAAAEKRLNELEARQRLEAIKQTAATQQAHDDAMELEKARLEMEKAAAAAAAAAPKFIAEHTVVKDETLSHIALKHYGSAAKPYYMHIYEANKETIGANPNVIRPGQVLHIPELPEELKK